MRSDKHIALRRAKAAKLLLQQPEITEALDLLEEDAIEALMQLQAGATGVEAQHRNIKSIQWLRQRLESYAGSTATLEEEIRAEDNYRSGTVHSLTGPL